MNRLSKYILGILIIIALALLVLIFIPSEFNVADNMLTTMLQSPVKSENTMPYEVLAIDFEQYNPNQMLTRFIGGEANILLWIAKKPQKNSAYVFNTAESLAKFSTDNSGYLDGSNPSFKNLAVGRYNFVNKKIMYTPIKSAGIAAIIINPQYLAAEILDDYRRYEQVVGKVVYSDSSSRVIRVIIVPHTDLENVTMEAAKVQ